MSDVGGTPSRRALVVTVSDGVAAGVREDRSGSALEARLGPLGFAVDRSIVPDDAPTIEGLLTDAAARYDLVVTTGGTGLSPRDVTPQATRNVLDYEIPGFGELMRSAGARSTPFSYLSRSQAGVRGRCLIVNVPGSPGGAAESLDAISALLDHALATVGGPFDHGAAAREAAPVTHDRHSGSV